MKPGIKTTEFWGKLVIQVTVALNAIFDLGIDITDEIAMAIIGGLEAIYNIVRGIVKTPPKTVTLTTS